MRTTPTLLVLVLLATGVRAQEEVQDDIPDTVAAWVFRLQTIAARHKGQTSIQKRVAYREFVAAVRTRKVEFISEIVDVDWDEGVARLYTTFSEDTADRPTEAAPLRLSRKHSFRLRMTEAQALALQKGDKLRVTATLTFTPRNGGDADREALFSLSFNALNGQGDFTSRDAAFEINGKKYTEPVREKKEPEPEAAPEKTKPDEKKAN